MRRYAYTKTITTSSGGAATVYFGERICGRVVAIKYVPGTIDTGAGLVISGETSGVAILTKASAGTSTVWYRPFAAGNKVADGAASTISEAPVFVHEERIKLVVASGGDTLTGTMTIYTEEE
jgi:hypothetical protein